MRKAADGTIFVSPSCWRPYPRKVSTSIEGAEKGRSRVAEAPFVRELLAVQHFQHLRHLPPVNLFTGGRWRGLGSLTLAISPESVIVWKLPGNAVFGVGRYFRVGVAVASRCA